MERLNRHLQHLLVTFGIFAFLFSVGCSGGGGDEAPSPTPSPVNSVRLTELDSYATGGRCHAVLKDGDYVYVADLELGLLVFHLQEDSLVKVATLPLSAPPPDLGTIASWSLAKHGDYLYIAAQTSELIVVDVANPALPGKVSSNSTTGTALSVLTNGDKLFLCDLSSFNVFSLQQADTPALLGAFDPYTESGILSTINGAVIAGDYAYVASAGPPPIFGAFGMLMFLDINASAKPQLIGYEVTPFRMLSVATRGNYLFAGGIGGGLSVRNSMASRQQDVLTAILPTTVQANPPAGASNFYQTAYQIVVHGHYAFMADGNNGISVVDVHNVDEPRIAARVKTGGQVTGIAVDGDLLVAADESTGVHLFRISEVLGRFAVMKTNYGTMKLELFEDLVPVTTQNFIDLAQSGFYDGLIFHRVIEGFMIQGGDPKGDGTGGPGYSIPDEFPRDQHGNLILMHDSDSTLSMANSGPDTGGSQFFVTVEPTPWLNGLHTVFGRVVEGFEVLRAINEVATDGNDKPLTDVVIESVTITP